ncbi:MAG: hypothetical protein R3E79_45245 [Caldilineaceae bacterium]
MKQRLCQPILRAIIAGIVATLMLNTNFAQAEPTATIVYWVFDVGTADSQFGYWDGTTSAPVGNAIADADFEGLSCIGSTIYATSGGDGNVASRLVQVTINKDSDTTTVTEVGVIQDANGQPFYEVAALAVRSSDNTLWAYAAQGPSGAGGTGIIQIDPTTGRAELRQAGTDDVAAIAWLDNTLYLADGNKFHTWTEGGAISDVLYEVSNIQEVEALDTTPTGTFYLGGDGSSVQEITPAGQNVNPNVFVVTDKQGASGDPESLTFCQTPTALAEASEPALVPTSLEEGREPVQSITRIYLPVMRQ